MILIDVAVTLYVCCTAVVTDVNEYLYLTLVLSEVTWLPWYYSNSAGGCHYGRFVSNTTYMNIVGSRVCG